MKARTLGALLGWVLLGALAFGVVLMHHVGSIPAASPVAATAEAGHGHHGHPAPGDECGHEQQHTCKAVLSGSGSQQAVDQPVVLTDSRADDVSATSVCPGKPALSGRLLLTTVCVFRL